MLVEQGCPLKASFPLGCEEGSGSTKPQQGSLVSKNWDLQEIKGGWCCPPYHYFFSQNKKAWCSFVAIIPKVVYGFGFSFGFGFGFLRGPMCPSFCATSMQVLRGDTEEGDRAPNQNQMG